MFLRKIILVSFLLRTRNSPLKTLPFMFRILNFLCDTDGDLVIQTYESARYDPESCSAASEMKIVLKEKLVNMSDVNA